MGVSDSFNLAVASVANWLVRSSVGQRRTAMTELLVRAQIERARHELRLQNLGRGEQLIDNVVRRLGHARPDGPPPVHDVLRAVAWSVLAYGLRDHRRKARADRMFTLAVELFERDGLSLTPRDSADFGIALAAVGREKEARRQLRLALVVDSAPPEAAGVLAALLADRQPARARELVGEALEALPGDPDLRLLQADLERRENDDHAGASYLQATRLFLRADRPADALSTLEKARAAGADGHDLIAVTGRIQEYLGDYRAAFEVYSEGLATAPDDVRLRVRRGACAAKLGDVDGATADLERTLSLADGDAKILAQAAAVALDLNNVRGAESIVDFARTLRPEADAAAAVSDASAQVRAARGDVAGALDDIRASCREAPPRVQRLRRYADLAGRAGEVAEQIDVLERIRSMSNADSGDFVRLALALDREGRRDEARAVLDDAHGNWPDDPRVAAERDRAAGPATRPGRDLTPVTGPDPQQAIFRLLTLHTRTARARSLAGADRYDEAETELAEVLADDPKYAPALALRAEFSLRDGDLTAAELVARSLLDVAADATDARLLLVRVLLRQGRHVEALAELDRIPVSDPAALSLRADALLAGYRYADADRFLEALADREPDRADVWARRARVARHLGDSDAAGAYAKQAGTLDPTDRTVRREIAACAVYADPFSDNAAAVSLLEDLRRDADDPDTDLVYADLVGLSLPGRAVELLREASDRYPHRVDVLAARARAVLRVDGGAAALDLLAADVRVDHDAAALCVRSEALRATRDSGAAIEVARRCLELAPDHPGGLAALGLALMDVGDGVGAVEVLRRAVTAAPHDPLALARLGHALAALNQLEESLDLLDRAAVAAPGQRWVLARLADVLSGAGYFSPAATLYRKVWQQQADRADRDTLNGLIWCLQHLEPPDLHEAVRIGRTAIAADPNDLWSKKNLANSYHRNGHVSEARELYNEVRDAARHRRTQDARYLGLASWCSFRLGDLTGAARGLYEIVSATRTPSSNHFELALVHLCDGRVGRGVGIYRQAMNQVLTMDREWRRGLLAIARSDLRQAVEDYPELQERAEVGTVLSLIDGALDTLPPRSVRALTVLDPTG